MRKLAIFAIAIGCLVNTQLVAQHSGSPSAGLARRSAIRAAPFSQHLVNGAAPGFFDAGGNFDRRFGLVTGFGGIGGLYYGYGNSIDLCGQEYSFQPNSNLPIVFQPAPVAPEPPVRPVIHEYQWPGKAGDPEAALSIESRDGSVHQAIAVWVQDGAVCFIAPNRVEGQVPLTEVARYRASVLNSQPSLKPPLPGEIDTSSAEAK